MLQGLSEAEAAQRLTDHGPNRLPEKAVDALHSIFLRQFQSPFIYVLLAAAIVSFGLGQLLNALFIVLVLLLNALIGTIQEYSAQRSAAALKKMVPQSASVIREGTLKRLDAELLVPGDIVVLVSGDRIPADLALLDSHELLVNESILTGESLAAAKRADADVKPDAALTARANCVFAGTLVTHGRAHGEVTATAEYTEIGRIAADVMLRTR